MSGIAAPTAAAAAETPDQALARAQAAAQARRFGEAAYYEEFPSLAGNCMEALAAPPVALLGLETPSLCAAHPADARAHRMLLGAGVVIVEGLTGLARLPERVWLIALPLRLVGLDGSPCRVIAVGE